MATKAEAAKFDDYRVTMQHRDGGGRKTRKELYLDPR